MNSDPPGKLDTAALPSITGRWDATQGDLSPSERQRIADLQTEAMRLERDEVRRRMLSAHARAMAVLLPRSEIEDLRDELERKPIALASGTAGNIEIEFRPAPPTRNQRKAERRRRRGK